MYKKAWILTTALSLLVCFFVSSNAATTLNFPITVTFLASGPTVGENPIVESFRLIGDPHPGWHEADSRAKLVSDGTGKADLLFQTGGDPWGTVTSNTFTDFDIDNHPNMRVVITNVDASTGNEIWLNDGGAGRILIGSGLGVGIHNFDIQTITGWSSPVSFYIELVVLSTVGDTGTRFDEIQIYDQNSNGMVEHFHLIGDPHPGWHEADSRAKLVGDGTGKADLLFQAGGDPWGTVTSNTLTDFDIDTYSYMRVVITNVDASTGNEIWLNDGGAGRILIGSGLGVGIHNFDIQTITGWSSPVSFYIELVVLSTVGDTGTRFDEIKIGTLEN